MNIRSLVDQTLIFLDDFVVKPMSRFLGGLDQQDTIVLYALVAITTAIGTTIGWVRAPRKGPKYSGVQNLGESLVSEILQENFSSPDYHLMNHLTLQMSDGTTQIDHILVSKFGLFVIETKHYSGWIFANAKSKRWTQVLYRLRFKFQNPIFQNSRHVRAVSELLDFLPNEIIENIVVFSASAEFKTDKPPSVYHPFEFADYVNAKHHELMSTDQMAMSVGRLEIERLAISHQTDIEHIASLSRRRTAKPRA